MQRVEDQTLTRVEKQRHFIQAMSRAIDGRPLSESDRALLDLVLDALLCGEDVSEIIGTRPPHDRRTDDPVYVAVHYLCLTKLMRWKSQPAWSVVGEAWGLKKRQVQQVIADNRRAALQVVRQFAGDGPALLQLCERQAGNAPAVRLEHQHVSLHDRAGRAVTPGDRSQA